MGNKDNYVYVHYAGRPRAEYIVNHDKVTKTKTYAKEDLRMIDVEDKDICWKKLRTNPSLRQHYWPGSGALVKCH